LRHVPGAGWATLLEDEEHLRRFISMGPWDSLEAIEGWRASAGFQERVGRIRELLESFEAGLFRRRAGIGAG
jgi:heme-degrading monooxygenase HmoA